MNSIDLIKTEIMSLYKINPRIHVNIFLRNPKIYLRNTPAVIKAVYEVVYPVPYRHAYFGVLQTDDQRYRL